MTQRSKVVLAVAAAAGLFACAVAACSGLRDDAPGGGAGAGDGSVLADGETPTDDAPNSPQDGSTKDGGGDAPFVPATPVIIATGQTRAYDIAVDNERVYWTVQTDPDASVRSVPIDGGTTTTVAPFDINEGFNPYASELELFGGDVYWTNITGGVGAVFSIPKTGGARSRIFKSAENGEPLAISGGRVFITTTFSDYAVASLDPDGGNLVYHQKSQINVTGLAVDNDRVYWAEQGPLAGKAAVAAKALDASADAQPSVLYQGTSAYDMGGIALAQFDVIWADMGNDRVMKVGKNGGPSAPLADTQNAPARVVVDGSWVYFTNFGKSSQKDGSIARVPLAGGNVQTLAKAQDHPLGLAVDANYIYWTNYGNGEIVRLAK